MKKIILILALVAVAVGCDKLNEKLINEKPTNGGEKVTLSATIEASSRVVIDTKDDETFNHFWQEGDQIRVFDGAGNAANFALDGYDPLSPSNVANFAGTFGYTPAGAVYPAANADAAFDGTNFTVTFPATQTYVADTYDPAANVYVATCSGTTLTFQPISCYLRVALYSLTASTAVDHIVVSSVGGEKIAGLATVTTLGVVEMDSSAGTSITLNCATPVTLSDNSDAPTYFYIAVPAVAVTNGLKVDVYKSDGSHLWRNVSVSPLVKKNMVLKMGALEYSPVGAVAATLESGGNVNAFLKHLAGTDTTAAAAYNVQNTSITKIVIETGKNMAGVKTGTAGTDYHVISTAGSAQEIVATVKGGVARIQTAADSIVTGSCSYMFMNFRGVTSYEGFDSHFAVGVSSYMNYMFRNNVALTSLDLSDITVYKQLTAKYTKSMFYNCSQLTELTLWKSAIYTRECDQMFQGCSQLTRIDNLNKLYSSGLYLTSTASMFKGCSSLEAINLSNSFDAKLVTDMTRMFEDCDALTTLDLRGLDTRNVKSMAYLCNSCDNLVTLDMSGTNCSTAAIPADLDTALKNVVCNDYKLATLKLGESFTCETPTAIHDQFFSNPTNASFKTVLNVWCTRTTANNLLHKCSRALTGIKASKFVLKTANGSTSWSYYSDEGCLGEPLSLKNVTSSSYVGPIEGEVQASSSDPVAVYNLITGGISF